MKKENAKQVAIYEVRQIQDHVTDLFDALKIFAEEARDNLAIDCAREVKELSTAVRITLKSLEKVKKKL